MCELEPRVSVFIYAYPDKLSYAPGETVSFSMSANVPEVSVEVARIGQIREVMWTREGIPGTHHRVPSDAAANGCKWPVSFKIPIPLSWSSGYYEVMLRGMDTRTGDLAESASFFVILPMNSDKTGRILLILATNTYNAYNDWGGPNLYTGGTCVSFQRPLAAGFLRKPEPALRYPNVDDIEDPDHERFRFWAAAHGLSAWSGSAGWYNWERTFVRWAERCGYKLDLATSADLGASPDLVSGYPMIASVGHDEYWTWEMRDTLENFIAHGGNVAFFSGNAVYWQVRYEDEGHRMVCYKYQPERDPFFGTDRQHLLTTMWSSRIVDRPENQLTGVSFTRGGYIRMGQAVPHASGGYTVWRPDHWAFRNTELKYGDVFGSTHATTVYEVDGCEITISPDDGLPRPTGRDGTPHDFTVLATAPARLYSRDELPSRYRPAVAGDLELTAVAVFGDASPAHIRRLAHNQAVLGTYTNVGTVFTAGTTDWACGLGGGDPTVEQITRNVLDRLMAPSSLGLEESPSEPAAPGV